MRDAIFQYMTRYRDTAIFQKKESFNLSNIFCCIASLIIPGLGQVFQRRIGKGLLHFLFGVALWFFTIGWIVHIWSAVSAYRHKHIEQQPATVMGPSEIAAQEDGLVIPFQLQKSESLRCLVPNTELYEYKTHRSRTGTSHGLSMRLAKGLWYRPGASQSQYHNEDALEHTDVGLFGMTDKHIYFAGSIRQFRIPRNRIVALSVGDDHMTITQDNATAKPQYFVFGNLEPEQAELLAS